MATPEPRKIKVTTPETSKEEVDFYPENAREINFKQAVADSTRNHKKDVAARKAGAKERK